jgi:hypothetical protein
MSIIGRLLETDIRRCIGAPGAKKGVSDPNPWYVNDPRFPGRWWAD